MKDTQITEQVSISSSKLNNRIDSILKLYTKSNILEVLAQVLTKYISLLTDCLRSIHLEVKLQCRIIKCLLRTQNVPDLMLWACTIYIISHQQFTLPQQGKYCYLAGCTLPLSHSLPKAPYKQIANGFFRSRD